MNKVEIPKVVECSKHEAECLKRRLEATTDWYWYVCEYVGRASCDLIPTTLQCKDYRGSL